LDTTQFQEPLFFLNKKQMSKEVFKKKIIDKIDDDDLRKRLELFYQSNLIAVKIAKIDSIGVGKTVDIETKNHNFIANGLVVHNSSQRFERITEGLAKEFFRRVADEMKKIFFDMPKLKGLLVGGPIPTKEDFLDEGNLVTKLKEKVIAVKDLGYVDEHGLELLVEASQQNIAEQELVKEKKIVEKFFNTLGKDKSLAVYGEEKVRLALERGAVEILLMSKNWDRDKEKELEQMAENISAKVVIVSTDHPDGEQFRNLSKGVGAILRFALE
jgi:peptide subunit release factor 1 (eRF1)